VPDSGIADGSTFTSAFFDTYVRQQVVVTCTSATRPSAVEGRVIYQTDDDSMYVYDGTAWTSLLEPVAGWKTYSPAIGGTGWALGNGTVTGRYQRVGRLVNFFASVVWGSTSTYGGSNLTLTLPVAARTSNQIINFRLVDVGTTTLVGSALTVSASATITPVVLGSAGTYVNEQAGLTTTVPFTWVSGDSVSFSGTYEANT
jgi:hypothetical protein